MDGYIDKIKLVGLWHMHDLEWQLRRGVNILSGGNGSGKSTLLRAVGELLRLGALGPEWPCLAQELIIEFSNGCSVSSASTFDPLQFNVRYVSNFNPSTPLPIALIRTLSAPQRELLLDMIDRHLAASSKRIDRSSEELTMTIERGGMTTTILPTQLSSGERQLITILVTAADPTTKTLIIDEPEISLQFEWQQHLLNDILKLNPSVQLLVATHSPAIVMNGWVDRIVEIESMLRPACR